jgi:hypothetical protein
MVFVVLHECECLRKGRTEVEVVQIKVLSRMCEYGREKVKKEWRKLLKRNLMICTLHYTFIIIIITSSSSSNGSTALYWALAAFSVS